MSAPRWFLLPILLFGCASTVNGSASATDAAFDSVPSDLVPASDGGAASDVLSAQHDSEVADQRCPHLPCLSAPVIRATSTATWILYPDGRTFLWGEWGPIGDSESNRHDTASPGPRLTSDVLDIAASHAHVCVLASHPRRVICWGQNTYGQLGRGTVSPQEGPGIVVSLMGAESIATRGFDSWALSSDGVFFWGGTWFPGLRGESSTPRLMLTAPRRVARFANGPSSFDFGFLTSDGEIYAFGRNSFSASGVAGDAAVTAPTRIAGISTAVDYSDGVRSSCAVIADGSVYCWGDRAGILAQRFSEQSGTAVPERVAGIDDAVRVHVGEGFACVLTRTRRVRCWGWMDWEPRDSTTTPGFSPPGPAMDLPSVRELAVGLGHACALTMDGEVYCWGSNRSGQLGIPRFYANSNRPRRVPLPQ